MLSFTTSPTGTWEANRVKEVPAKKSLQLNVSKQSAHPVLGFGGCFNELGARGLFALSEEKKNEALQAIFGDDGCRFSFCRVPIGASDYSIEWYSHNDTFGDYEMKHFSIAHDYRFLIPYIREALSIRPDLKLFASPWSPPIWLKEKCRYNGSRLRQESRVFEALAEYFLRFVTAYRQEGIEINQVHVQNEPRSSQNFPSCIWTGIEMRNFIRDYLGPRFEAARETCEIWAGTIEKGILLGWAPEDFKNQTYHEWAHVILSDPHARKYIHGIGYQWCGKGALQQTRANWPEVPIIQTENECGDGKNTWDYAFYTFDLMWHYFANFASAYVYWNMLLPPGGESTWGWPQNTLITIDEKRDVIIYNPEYWIMKHVSHFVEPGATVYSLTGDGAALSLLFKNSNGQWVFILSNPLYERVEISLALDNDLKGLCFPPRSISTLVI
ncbi:glycoside hydrolase family 30 protein [Cerasicoccus maritimus]|uniref:glycoside hydrolase family 30 protein n=1 Tax=Cerasicoccus maritimus TaxID=490089 RepID=UPI002852836E|nr:hypothetical protein [Cerasicoccus maritimus]